jgi:GNAT superfamily N-acetyltransferase
VTVTPEIRHFAEEPDRFISEAPPPTRRITHPAFVAVLSPSPNQTSLSSVRTTAAELDRTIDEIRANLREAKSTGCVWSVGPSCRPDGLRDLLLARGFAPVARPPYESHLTVMALAAPPPPPRPGAEARVIRDFDEYVQAMRIALVAYGESEEDSAAWLAAAPTLWSQGDAAHQTHLAFVDGRPVGFAFAVRSPAGLVLGGSGVLPEYRGRGAYRALVAARWDLAVRLGTPALTIHAGSMSRPILERCGFETICQLEMLDDRPFWDEHARNEAPP